MADCTEIRLDTRQGALAGLAWRRQGRPRVLALHGWLDNANSFQPMAPLLGQLDLVALDLPGHGHSDHRHSTARYHFVDYLYFSTATYTSLGYGDIYPLGGLRLMAGIETITGLMMIAWSASFTYLTMEKFWGLHGPRRR